MRIIKIVSLFIILSVNVIGQKNEIPQFVLNEFKADEPDAKKVVWTVGTYKVDTDIYEYRAVFMKKDFRRELYLDSNQYGAVTNTGYYISKYNFPERAKIPGTLVDEINKEHLNAISVKWVRYKGGDTTGSYGDTVNDSIYTGKELIKVGFVDGGQYEIVFDSSGKKIVENETSILKISGIPENLLQIIHNKYPGMDISSVTEVRTNDKVKNYWVQLLKIKEDGYRAQYSFGINSSNEITDLDMYGTYLISNFDSLYPGAHDISQNAEGWNDVTYFKLNFIYKGDTITLEVSGYPNPYKVIGRVKHVDINSIPRSIITYVRLKYPNFNINRVEMFTDNNKNEEYTLRVRNEGEYKEFLLHFEISGKFEYAEHRS